MLFTGKDRLICVYRGCTRVIEGIYYRDNGKEHGNYYSGFRVWGWGFRDQGYSLNSLKGLYRGLYRGLP